MPETVASDRDAWECAAKITAIGKRVLLLHGQGADERDAFVEHRLAPLLEAPSHFFGLLRSSDGAIVRGSHDLAGTIVPAIHAVAAGTGQVGPTRRLHLAGKLAETIQPVERPVEELAVGDVDHAEASPFLMLEALTRFSADTVVLVVSEPAVPEVMAPDDPFLGFLRALGETQIDAKVIVTVDGPTYGRLKDAMAARGTSHSYTVSHEVR